MRSRSKPKPLLNSLTAQSVSGIEKKLIEMIRSGDLPSGSRLPPVRSLAQQLDVSTGTVAEAWRRLRSAGLVETRRRGGTIVRGPESSRKIPLGGWLSVDLAQGTADPQLLPPIREALQTGMRTPHLNDPHKEPITEALLHAVRKDWPFQAQSWSTHGGGTEGALLALEAAAPHGSLIALEDPTSPRILDSLKFLGLGAIPVLCDAEGPRPDALQAALRKKPVAFMYQPRAQLPLGHTLTRTRIADLADVIRRSEHRVNVVEDDNTGPIALSPPISMGTLLPDRVIHVRSYCKTFGIDLHTSIVAGAVDLVERAQELRSHNIAMTSRIFQDAIAHLITDGSSQRILEKARARYADRRQALTGILRKQGFKVQNRDGVVVWLEVPDEASTLVNLAAHGVTVGAGSRCRVIPGDGQHLRIATSRLPDDQDLVEHLGRLIAMAAVGKQREEFD